MESNELELLRNKCLLFNSFLIDKGGLSPELIESYKESNRLIEKAYEEGKIKPLKSMSIDIDDQVIRHMPLSMATELKLLFKKNLDIDFNVVDKKREKKIEKIIKRGKITSPDEYELLNNYADEIFQDPSRRNELELINKILTRYR